MTAKRECIDYIRDIADAAEKAQRFTSGMHFAGFQANDEKVFAVTRALEIIGEAAKHVPQAVRARYRDVPWRELAGMRDKIAHEYFRVHLRRLWDTVQQDLPPLRTAIARMLQDLERRGDKA